MYILNSPLPKKGPQSHFLVPFPIPSFFSLYRSPQGPWCCQPLQVDGTSLWQKATEHHGAGSRDPCAASR